MYDLFQGLVVGAMEGGGSGKRAPTIPPCASQLSPTPADVEVVMCQLKLQSLISVVYKKLCPEPSVFRVQFCSHMASHR